MPMERDEGEYAYNAWIFHNQLTPYEHSFLQKPPLIIYTYWLAQQIGGTAIWAPRLLSILFTLATIYLLFLIAKKQFSTNIAWLTALATIPLLSLPHLTALAANTEKFMLLPLSGVLFLYVYYQSKERTWTYLLAGALGALAFLYKPICILPLFFIYLVWLGQNYRSDKQIKPQLINTLFIASGFILTVFVALLPFLSNKVALQNMWEQVIVFNSKYAASMNQLWWAPLKYLKIFWQNWWLLIIIATLGFFRPVKEWWFYLVLLILSWLTVFTSPIGHYYLLLMPFLVILFAGSLHYWLEKSKKRFNINEDNYRALTLLSVFIIIISLVLPIKEQFTKTPTELSLWIYGADKPFIESWSVAEKVKELTTDKDKIFIAGSETQIYFFSQRQSVSQFDYTYPFVIETPWQLNYQQQGLDELQNNNPKVIVYSTLPDSGLWSEGNPRLFIDGLNKLIQEKYQLVGGFVRDQNYGSWQQPLTTQEQFNNSSLLLFLKK